MVLKSVAGELKMGLTFANIPAIPRLTKVKLVCRLFASLTDDILVEFARDKENGFRLKRILCEPNERSLNILKAVSANPKLNSVIRSLHCYSPKNSSESILAYLEDFSEAIRSFPDVQDLMINSVNHRGSTYWFPRVSEWDGVGELFFEWFAQILWTLSKMKKGVDRMLDIGGAPLSLLASWTPYGCSVRTRTFANITTIFIDIGATGDHDGESQAWNIILKNSTCLSRLEFDWDETHRCTHRRKAAINFIYQCLKWQDFRNLFRLRLPLGFSNTELFNHFLRYQESLYSLEFLLDFEDFESAEGAIGFLDTLKRRCWWECSISMRGWHGRWNPSPADQAWTKIANDGAVVDWRDDMRLGYNVGHYLVEGKKEWDNDFGIWEHKDEEDETNGENPGVTG